MRKWRAALLQVVTRGLNISGLGSRRSLTLESALGGKATSDIMKHSLTSRLSSLLSLTSSCIEHILTEAFLQVCTMPELRGEI